MGGRREKVRKGVIHRALTPPAFAKVQAHIEAEIAARARQWNCHGWAIVGSRRAVRIEVCVSRTLVAPAHAVSPIPLPSGDFLKPSVRATGLGLCIPRKATVPDLALSELSVEAVIDLPLAPGSFIFVGSAPVQRAGVACVVRADDKVYLLTCGHVFEPGAANTGVFVQHKQVARLTKNFLDTDEKLDAACCEVLPAGQKMLDASGSATTWLDDVLAPVSGWHKDAVFWPTNEWASDEISTTIDSYSASESALQNDFWPNLTLSGLIRTQPITEAGDSGSLLSVGDSYYGLCSGTAGSSYFTPLGTTLERMRQLFTEVELWHPDS